MKFIHLADLHIGKRVLEYSMTGEQAHILGEILRIIGEERPDAVLIAGDVYDKSIPSVEAVEMFDGFLSRLAECGAETFIISGNHDSPERVGFASGLIDHSGIHLSPAYRGGVKPYPLRDSLGTVNLYMLPFLKPAVIRPFFPDAEIDSWTDALRTAVEGLGVDPAARNVLVAHQFVTGAVRSESEEVSVGGADNVDASVFDAFDYVALGHLHRPQNVGSPRVRYAGSPLKYSFSEADHDKSVTVAELGEKGELTVRTVPLIPLRDMRRIRGTYRELTDRSAYLGTATDDLLRITLTDEEEIPDAAGKLAAVYPNLLKLDYDNARTRAGAGPVSADEPERKTPVELFAEFFEKQNGAPLSEDMRAYAEALFEKIGEENG